MSIPIKNCGKILEALGVDKFLADTAIASMELSEERVIFDKKDILEKLLERGYGREECGGKLDKGISELSERGIIKESGTSGLGKYVVNTSELLGFYRVLHAKRYRFTRLGQQVAEDMEKRGLLKHYA